jgi:hypothetical protein
MGVLFAIMAAIVVAVIATAIIVGPGGQEQTPAANQQPAATNYVSVKTGKRTDWPEAEPWQGLTVGMNRQQVTDLFGQPNAQTVQASKSLEVMEFHNNPERAGIFGTSGGVRLTVYIDTDTGKVVYFTPPKTAEQAIREYQEAQNR